MQILSRYPPDQRDQMWYLGALRLASALKGLAVVMAVVGVAVAFRVGGVAELIGLGTGDQLMFRAFLGAGAVLGAGLSAFCGYALEILVRMAEEARRRRP
ncbi:MAG: hypothetical protein ACRDY7_05935 [Acidimicrobiia bacterium]